MNKLFTVLCILTLPFILTSCPEGTGASSSGIKPKTTELKMTRIIISDKEENSLTAVNAAKVGEQIVVKNSEGQAFSVFGGKADLPLLAEEDISIGDQVSVVRYIPFSITFGDIVRAGVVKANPVALKIMEEVLAAEENKIGEILGAKK